MVFDAVDIFSLILFLVWQCLNTTPKKQKLWIYSRVFPSQVVLESILACASIIFAPGLFETLQNASGRISKRWAAYVIVWRSKDAAQNFMSVLAPKPSVVSPTG
jgi:hypothetical protein